MKQPKFIYVVLLAAMVSFTANANPQPHAQSTAASTKTADTTILTYIAQGGNPPSRTIPDCNSPIDPKVRTAPILSLPAGMETPPAVATAHQQCNVEVSHLPRKITHIGDVRVSEIPVEGL